MDPEFTDIATRGATALAGLMVTSAWDRVKPRVAAMFGGRAESISEDLDETRAEVAAAPEDSRESAIQSAQGEWQPKLRRLLADNPAMAEELQAILDEFTPQQPQQVVHETYNQTIKGGTFSGTTIMAGKINEVHKH
ncbi:hypothetical protein ACIRST_06750 [Kitasatospora sp. NPDC101447]|uniref:hypothetical protein n=1 Tax=Kitasatospora sp. NPDC101447 TaxID=3364102 RepID=UPI003817852A